MARSRELSSVSRINALTSAYDETVSEEVYVKIRSLIEARLLVAGSVTGEQYVFECAGSEVKVNIKDVNALISRRYGGCCGGTPYAIFELVMEV